MTLARQPAGERLLGEKPSGDLDGADLQKPHKSQRHASTADFGSLFGDYQHPADVVTELGGGKFRVRAWVDAQNSFGVTIRNRFVCELEYVRNDRWRVTHLKFMQ